ncbi:MAG: fatty acid desaturase [Pseudomonadota bacterium]
MDHVTALAALPDAKRQQLTERRNTPGLVHLAGHLGLLCICGSYIALQGPLWPVMMLPHGIALVFLFTLTHECTHQTPFRTRWLNETVGHVTGSLLLLPFLWFRYFHFAHHRFTNDPDRDPELANGAHPTIWRDWLVYLSGWRYWTSALSALWHQARGQEQADYLPVRQYRAVKREARWLLAIYALALASLTWTPLLLWIWIVPLLLGQPVLRAYLLAEHGLCPQVSNMLENSRTTYTGRAVRWLAWNMPYHAEHHAHPAVPFHNLPALHEDLAASLKSTSPGYRAFTRTYAAQLSR